MSFEEFVRNQYELGEQIENLARNFSKDPKERKTSAYYSKRLETLTRLAEKFHKNNTAMLAMETYPEDDEYFATAYYEKIRAIVVKHTKLFEAGATEPVPMNTTAKALSSSTDEPAARALSFSNGETPAGSEIRRILRNQRALMHALTKNIDEIFDQREVHHHQSYYTIQASILEKHMVDLATNNATLWELTDEDSIDDYTLQTYYELESRAKAAMIELQQHMTLEQPLPQPRASTREIDVPLPRITLPTFDGNYQRWLEFKDLYVELVHNATISDAKKMHYLISSLDGEPKNLIKHLPVMGSNYAVAWSLINSRYENKRLLVSTLLNKLMSQPSVKKETASSLKSLHDTTKECIHGLRVQGIPINHWSVILAHIVLRKIDHDTQTIFEQGLDDNKRLITIDEVLKFLERRFQSLEVRGRGESSSTKTCASVTNPSSKPTTCQICKGESHKPYTCKTFVDADLKKRWKWVKDLSLCVNCLGIGHRANECKARHCTKCTKNHHTLLHNQKANQTNQNTSQGSISPVPQQPTENSTLSTTKISLITNNTNKESSYVLLGTACIKLIAANGQHINCRAILDSGSQVNLITQRILKKLGGTCRSTSINIEGVGAKETKMRHQCTIKFLSTLNDYAVEINAHAIPKIVSDQPMHHLDTRNWGIPKGIRLADPEFANPGRIDCLLGAEVFFELITDGQIRLSDNLPVLQNSVLGWIVAGNLELFSSRKATCGICTTSELESAVSKFWESDASDSSSDLTEDDLHCESHFLQHTTRAPDGRFVVKLPLKHHPSVLSESKGMAFERFKSIEQRLINNPTLKDQYISFMREYENLGHMTRIKDSEIPSPHYFIPHHCVLRPDSTTTKLRVVFDASAHKSSAPSLNDIMFNGPIVQSDLFSILLRFRKHRYVLKTDVEKMYRQVWVTKEDRNLQLILWRENPQDPLQTFQLNTITYGTRTAPYLATRCLIKLAEELKGQFPQGSLALRKDFYVDDGLTGADSIHEALLIQQQLIKILSGAGMKLKKWCSNNKQLLSGIAPEDQEVSLDFESRESQRTKTLGLLWLPKSDSFCIKANILDHTKFTKRTMSSDLAHIYDPLGLIGPVLVTGKIQLQRTWQQKLDWDEELPAEIHKQWACYRQDLSALDNVKFPRYLFSNQEYNSVEIHAFADASEKAYGAAVYIRAIQKDKTIKINLLCSKSRVAPIKPQTIPRLELCAALLAAELMARVRSDLGYEDKAAYCWSDSQIVLSWLQNHPGKLPVFISHRVVKILRLTIADQWRHVPSKQNPADVLSRGIKPSEFLSCNMWLYGPLFLYQQKARWPAPFKRELTSEENAKVAALTTQQHDLEDPWIYAVHSKNSFPHLQRVIGYVLRFVRNARQPKQSRPENLQLSSMELESALKLIVRQIQNSEFADVKKTLKKDKFVSKHHNLSALTPFLDEENIIRVGGRLSSSLQQYDAKHQMILPSNDQLVKLLIEEIHKKHYHCGPQALLSQVRQRFWPLKGKSLARSIVQRCVRCTRARPIVYNQLMGELPKHRVQPARPFINSGVDYCGPFWVHYKTRGKRPQKAYLAVFCCFATKAIHLELVTELTTDAFIGALKRFIGRRGRCKTLYCDNATNFVGARNQLKELEDVIYAKDAQRAIIENCNTKGIEFRFIPPRSPHFGGLWEAAVKSAKHLLMKNISPVSQTSSLTYEELETIIVEIEAILNSRPLIPNSSNANDLNAITPGHFLIGEELTASVDANAQEQKANLLERWQLVSQLKHSFWKRWSTEYLNELQQRHKWKGPIKEIAPNTMVIIKEDNIPVLQWPLGRIIKSIKGDDGVVRVCEVKTQKGIFKRPVHRLAPLFPENETKGDEPNEETPQSSNSNSSSLPVSIPLNKLDTGFLHNDATPAKRPRLNSSLLLTIMTLLFLPIALCNQVNVTRFNNKPGTYFEQLSMVKRMSANWKMIIYFDLGQYQDQINVLHDATVTLQKLCDNAATNVTCDFLLNYLDHATNEIQADISLFNTRRSKRGAIDLVGNFANSLFGVLDSNYATQMSKTINELKERDDHMEQLVKNQTSLIDSTINLMKKTQLNIQAKFDEIDTRIHQLLFSNQTTTDLQLQQQILLLSLQTFMVISNLQRIQSSIFDVLIDSQHNKVNPLLLTPQQFTEELLKIKSHLPSNSHLPFHENNILEAYQIINVKGIIAKQHAIFCIDLPLTDARELQLFHLVPIAAALNNTLSTVELSTRFLALTPHRDEFFPMNQHEVDTCLPISENELLCPNIQATYQAATQPLVNKCEIDLLNNLPEPRCKLRRLDDTTVWQQLHNRNQWIFATLNTIKFNAVCGDDTLELTLAASGLMTLHPDCTIKNDLITIQGQQQIVTSLQLSLSKVNPAIGWVKQFTSNNISIKAFVPTIHEFEEIQNKLAELHAFTSSTEFSNTHTMITSYLAIALIAIAGLIIIYNWRKFRKTGNPNKMSNQDVQKTIEDTEC